MSITPRLSTSKRAIQVPPSPIRKLAPFAQAAKREGVKVYHLNIGQPDIKSPPRFLKALRNYTKKIIAYENSLGNPALREALVTYYGGHNIPLEVDNIIVTTGGSEAIFFALLATCDFQDECLVFEPFYANYAGFAAMAGAKLIAIRTIPEDGFHLPSTETIEARIGKRTRAILITNPNNPTGTVYTRRELAMVNALAKKHNLTLIADETYREFVYGKPAHKSLLTYGKPRHTILVDSLSKRYSLCGARVGCLVSYNREVLAGVEKFAQARLSSPSVEQEAAVEALKTPESYFERIKQEYKKRRDVLVTELENIPGVFVKKPEGAFYCIAGLPVRNAEHFAQWLLTDFREEKSTVMVAPAEGFYLSGTGKSQVRIAYVLNTTDLAKAARILKNALSAYPE